MAELIWKLELYQLPNGQYQAKIYGEGGRSMGRGAEPYTAYRDAECKLTLKPAFFREPGRA